MQAPDSTLFLGREFGSYYLGRLEQALKDPPSGEVLTTKKRLALSRVSVSGDGSFGVFVTEDDDLGLFTTDGATMELLNQPGTVHSVAMSPDGNHYAFVGLDGSGKPGNEIIVIDAATKKGQTIKLYAPGTEDAKLDIVRFADVMDFLPDGQALVYDAYAESTTKDGATFGGWTLFALDVATKTISLLIDLDEDYDFGNPSLGNSKTHLLAFETRDKKTGISSLFVGNLQTGELKQIGTLPAADIAGVPCFTGDDRAIVYTQADSSASSGASLYWQALATDGMTPIGKPELWLKDALVGVIYRRGTFASSNALPSVDLISPMDGQSFAPHANITVEAAASDRDGTIARVEFYEGSTKLGEDAAAPYSLSFPNAPAGRYRLIARAIDNLGGASDSSAITITVGEELSLPVRIMSWRRDSSGVMELQFTAVANANYRLEASTDLKTWTTLETINASETSVLWLPLLVIKIGLLPVQSRSVIQSWRSVENSNCQF